MNDEQSKKDVSTNEILAYHLSKRITLDIATTTIDKLMKNHKHLLHHEAFIHSDQGCHYTSPIFQRLLKKYKLGQSMSRREIVGTMLLKNLSLVT